MANSIEQEIKIKLKAVLEGFDALKQAKNDAKSLMGQKLNLGERAEVDKLASAVAGYNKQLNEGVKTNKGFIGSVFEIIHVFGSLGDFVQGVVKAFQFFGVTGAQVISAIKTAFSSLGSIASTVFTALKSGFSAVIAAISSAASSGSGFLSSLSSSFSGLVSQIGAALPSIGGLTAGIAGIGIAAGAVLGVVLAVVAAVAAFVAVAGGIALVGTVGSAGLLALAQSGFKYLAALEQIELGTGALIAQLSEIRNADGIKLEGADAVNAGILLAQEEMKKLRVDAIQTTATFEQLATVFQAAVGSGLGAGLKLDEIRKITVQLSQAGAALGVPYDQMRQEVNSILEGTIDINSRIAKNLGITNEEVKAWKQKGTLAEELNKKLAAFNAAGVKSAQTLNGLTSNLQEALNVFSGEATTKAFEKLKERLSKILSSVFDFKAGGLDKAFKPIADLIDKVLVQSIERFAGWIEQAIGFAKQLGKFIADNRNIIDDILSLVDEITRSVVGIITDFFGLTSTTDTWRGALEAVKVVLEFINGLLKIYRATQQRIYSGWLMVANAVSGYVLPAVNGLIDTIPGLRQLVQILGLIAQYGKSEGGAAVQGGLSYDPNAGATYKPIKNSGKGEKGKKGKANQIAEANDELEKARIQNAVNEYIAGLKIEEAALKDSYDNRKIATDKYYDDLGLNQKRTIDAEIIKEQRLLELSKQKLARSKEIADQKRAQADIETSESRIAVLQGEAMEKLRENDREKKKALEELRLEYEELANVLKTFEGLGLDADVNRLNEKYRETIERATAEGRDDIVKLIEGIKKYEAALLKLGDNEKKYNNALAERDNELEKIKELVEQGAIDEVEAGNRRIAIEKAYKGELLDIIEAMIILAKKANEFDKVIALQGAKRKIENSGSFTNPELLQREMDKFNRLRDALNLAQSAVDTQANAGQITPELAAAKRLQMERLLKTELQGSIDKMRELAAATASLDDDIAVENLALEIANLGQRTDTFKVGVLSSLRDGFGGFLSSLSQDVSNLGAAFQNMITGILSSLAQLAANELLRSLFASKSVNGNGQGGGGLGGILGAIGSFFGGGFAEGGHIRGAGSATSDSIPIMASDGEFMVKAATVKRLGVPFLNWLNRGGNIGGLFGKFAAGGAITASGNQMQGAGESASGNGVRIINVIDPALVKDYLGTSGGETAILNVLKRNPAFIKQILT